MFMLRTNNPVVPGSKWGCNDGRRFRVLGLAEIDDHIWVHYILEGTTEPQEYSCYLESFLVRFTPLPESYQPVRPYKF